MHEIIDADLSNPAHQAAVLALTAAYALDEFGNGAPLPSDALERLVAGLREHPTTVILLAYRDARAVGIATCFLGFSTFLARRILNIHDLAVLPECRGQGIGRKLLEAVDGKARELGCGKVTLEVHENNTRARGLYEQTGFKQSMHVPSSGGALFYTKPV